MDKIIGQNQSAFIKGRYIMDGVVILNEVVEEAMRNKARRMILKVDFEKAYDSVEWDYLFRMLHILKFPTRWIKWIKEGNFWAKS